MYASAAASFSVGLQRQRLTLYNKPLRILLKAERKIWETFQVDAIPAANGRMVTEPVEE